MERIVAMSVVGPYTLDLTFDDGTQRRIDFEDELWGTVFEPLRDPASFAQGTIDPVLGVVVRPNGADFSPGFLYYGKEAPPPGYYDAPGESDEIAEESLPVLSDAR